MFHTQEQNQVEYGVQHIRLEGPVIDRNKYSARNWQGRCLKETASPGNSRWRTFGTTGCRLSPAVR